MTTYQATDNTSPSASGSVSNVQSPNGDTHGVNGHARVHSIMDETEAELTEDELEVYEEGILSWDKAKSWRFWIRKEWTGWYLAFALVIVIVALMAFFHHHVSR